MTHTSYSNGRAGYCDGTLASAEGMHHRALEEQRVRDEEWTARFFAEKDIAANSDCQLAPAQSSQGDLAAVIMLLAGVAVGIPAGFGWGLLATVVTFVLFVAGSVWYETRVGKIVVAWLTVAFLVSFVGLIAGFAIFH